MSVDQAVVVSPRKSGTHLVQELMTTIGYYTYGESIPPPGRQVALSLRQRASLAERFLAATDRAALDPASDRDGFVHATNTLWWQVADMWQVRLAATRRPDVELSYPGLYHALPMPPEAWRRPFSDTPDGICWIFHAIDVWRMDQAFLREWQVAWKPRVVLNHRDPRDALVSMAQFLSGETGHTFARQPELAVFRPVLENLPDLGDRITYLLRDPVTPLLSDFESAISLFHHPQVCSVSFEELVGPRGGGSSARQLAAVRRVAEHVEADVDATVIADKLFNPEAYSFHRGRIGSWRDLFTERHIRMFESRFGHLLESFQYD